MMKLEFSQQDSVDSSKLSVYHPSHPFFSEGQPLEWIARNDRNDQMGSGLFTTILYFGIFWDGWQDQNLAIFVGFMVSQVWPIHHFQAPGGFTRSFTSGGGAEARSARPGAEGFGISVEPWKVRIRHQPQWVWNFCTQTGKVGFGEQFLKCHSYCMDSMLNSEVEALKEEVLGALELFSFRFTNWENHLDHLPRWFTPSEPTAFRSQGTARAGATTSWGWEARVMPWDSHFGSWTWYQLSSVLGHKKVLMWVSEPQDVGIFSVRFLGALDEVDKDTVENTRSFPAENTRGSLKIHLLQIVASLLLFPTFKHPTQ